MKLASQNVWNSKKGSFEPGILEVSKGRISKLEFRSLGKKDAQGKVLDFESNYVFPSAIDLHVHSRDFRESHKETFASLEAQAFKGGVCVAACMANTLPRLDSETRVRDFLKKAKAHQLQLIPFAAVTKNLEGTQPTDWTHLLSMPVAGLSDDGKPIMNREMMVAAAKAIKKSGKVFSLHEEDLHISCGSVMHRSPTSVRMGVEGSSEEAEALMVERDLQIAQETKAHLHFGHMSSKRAIDLLRKARKQRISFSAELTPHHALLSVNDAESFSHDALSTFKVCPPVRGEEDRRALRAALKDGILDCLASDHAPHSSFEKDRPMASAAHGMISMEYHLSLYNEVRLASRLTWRSFMNAWRFRPAELLGMSAQKKWDVGGDADVLVVDVTGKQTIDFSLSPSRNSPFQKKNLRGRVISHWIRGEKVYG